MFLQHMVLKLISVLKELHVSHIFGTKSAVNIKVSHVSLVLVLLVLPSISPIANASEVARLASHPTEGKKILFPARHDDIVQIDHTVMFELQMSAHILYHLEVISLCWSAELAAEGVVPVVVLDVFLLSGATGHHILATEVTRAGHLMAGAGCWSELLVILLVLVSMSRQV